MKVGKRYKKIGSVRIGMAGNISAVVNPYLWERFENDENYDDDDDE